MTDHERQLDQALADGRLGHALVRVMARRCGLQDPEVFAANGGLWAKNTETGRIAEKLNGGPWATWPIERRVRGTGRTTRMLLQALVALECGATVEIVARDPHHAEYLRERSAALAANFAGWRSPDRVRYRWEGCSHDPNEEVLADVRVVDHTVEA